MADPEATLDSVDLIEAQWRRERPDVDVWPMAVIGRISRLERAFKPLLERVFARHGLEAWEFDVLASLRRAGEPYQLTPGQLLDTMMVASATMTHRLDRLEGRGLVVRAKSVDDGRRVIVALTADGLATIDGALDDHVANEAALLGALDDEQRDALVDLLRILHRSLVDDEPPPAP
ncbi:MAG: MarR family winged helix-turn-helix transcriptional regulator [Acidimicrobiales bacterium]